MCVLATTASASITDLLLCELVLKKKQQKKGKNFEHIAADIRKKMASCRVTTTATPSFLEQRYKQLELQQISNSGGGGGEIASVETTVVDARLRRVEHLKRIRENLQFVMQHITNDIERLRSGELIADEILSKMDSAIDFDSILNSMIFSKQIPELLLSDEQWKQYMESGIMPEPSGGKLSSSQGDRRKTKKQKPKKDSPAPVPAMAATEIGNAAIVKRGRGRPRKSAVTTGESLLSSSTATAATLQLNMQGEEKGDVDSSVRSEDVVKSDTSTPPIHSLDKVLGVSIENVQRRNKVHSVMKRTRDEMEQKESTGFEEKDIASLEHRSDTMMEISRQVKRKRTAEGDEKPLDSISEKGYTGADSNMVSDGSLFMPLISVDQLMDDESRDKMRRILRTTLDKLSKHSYAWLFKKPVEGGVCLQSVFFPQLTFNLADQQMNYAGWPSERI